MIARPQQCQSSAMFIHLSEDEKRTKNIRQERHPSREISLFSWQANPARE
jgi:hypothetical protein